VGVYLCGEGVNVGWSLCLREIGLVRSDLVEFVLVTIGPLKCCVCGETLCPRDDVLAWCCIDIGICMARVLRPCLLLIVGLLLLLKL
jgi:hypothetical protein